MLRILGAFVALRNKSSHDFLVSFFIRKKERNIIAERKCQVKNDENQTSGRSKKEGRKDNNSYTIMASGNRKFEIKDKISGVGSRKENRI